MTNIDERRPIPPQRRPTPSLFWPVVLIVGGILILLGNLGYLPEPSWNLLWRLWPVLLIAMGIDVLVGRRSTAGAILSGILIFILIGGAVLLVFFARQIPMIAEMARAPDLKWEHVEYTLDNLEQADVSIDWSSVPGSLSALDDSTNLIEGDIDYYGTLIFDVDMTNDSAQVRLDTLQDTPVFEVEGWATDREGYWDVALNPSVVFNLTLDAGSGKYTFDLSEFDLEALDLDGGSGEISLRLPEADSFEGYIEGGSGDITVMLPENVGLRVELDSGSGAFRTGERFVLVDGEPNDDSVWETENFGSADYKITLEIDQGSGDITIR
ncbi:MAG: hypothetical protein JXB35_13380 [Anaerolineae bacterium]|nr:hypothetical protein [Anaerolineae bacterium]